MIVCNHCGQSNDDSSLVCRYCGTNLRPTRQAQQQAEYVPPAPPHIWATNTPPPPAPQVSSYPAPSGYRCPRCGTNYPPQVATKVSSDGWLVLILLLFFCAPLFWIGLLMKEEYRVCPMCRLSIT